MAHTRAWVVERVAAVVAGLPSRPARAVSPFSFRLQPTGAIDGVFRIEVAGQRTAARFGMTEEQTDEVTVWVARRKTDALAVTYGKMLDDLNTIRSAVIRDGLTGGGDYLVEAGGGQASIESEDGQEFLVGKLVLPINYDVTL